MTERTTTPRHAAVRTVTPAPEVEASPPTRPGAFRSPWFWTISITLVAIAPWLSQVRPVENLVVLTVFVIICAAGIARSVAGAFRPMLCFFSVFNVCWLGVPAAYQLTHHRAAWGDYGVFDHSGRTFTALLVLAVGTGAMLLGYETAKDAGRLGPVAQPELDPRRSRTWSLITLTAAVLVLPIVVRSVGGFAGLFQSRYDVANSLAANGFDYGDTGGAIFALVRIVPGVLSLVALLLALGTVRHARTSGAKLPVASLLLCAGASLMVTIYLNPIANSRYNFVTALGAVVLVWFRPRTRTIGRVVAVGAVVGLLVIYPLGNIFRYGFNTTLSQTAVTTGFAAFYSPDFDGSQQAVNSVEFVEDNGHTDGMEVASAALIAVPRSIWPDKAVPTNVRVAENRGYSFTNLSIPVQSELYIDLGFIGMILLMFLWGRIASRVDTAWRTVSAQAPLVAFVCVAQIGLVRGPISAAGGFAGLGLLLLWLALRAPRPSSRRAA